MNDILNGLNPQQTKAASILSGPMLILAGAGSGKTKTLTHRIANIIANGTPAEQILAVTFTNKAAGEMKTRIEKILQSHGNFSLPAVGTFHSICVRILREDIENLDGFTKNFVIFDSADAQSLIKLILKDFGYADKTIKPRAVASHISSAKNQLIPPHAYAEEVESNMFTEVVKRVYPEYQKRLRQHNALDFDDLLQKTVQLLENHPAVLAKYQYRWQHLMVDEYQDTNFAQYRMVRMLSDKHQNLCVIGDDHQSIYKFRGADYTNILNFEKDFPAAQVVKLEQNYRSTKSVLANANALINHNTTGQKKELWTDNHQGESVQVTEVFNEKDEGNKIAESIQDLVDKQEAEYKDCAILYRMNSQSRSIEEALLRHQIPYQIVGGTRFFDRKEIKDIIAYLRLIFNVRDDVSFLRIINVPSRKLGAATLQTIQNFSQQYSMSLFEILQEVEHIESLNATKKKTFAEFRNMISELQEIAQTNPISILIDRLLQKTNYLKFLDDGTPEGESRQQNVKELFTVAIRYDGTDNPLADFLEGVALMSELDNMSDKNNTVTLMTVHASKGLEFPHVFLPGWEEGIFPSNMSGEKSLDDFEEERRLGYVAITRAEKTCHILHTKQRMLFGRTNYPAPSPFLNELDEQHITRTSEVSSNSSWQQPSWNQINRNAYGANKYASQGRDIKVNINEFERANPNIARLNQAKPKTRTEALFGSSANAGNSTDYAISDKVKHPEWGVGTIITISGEILSIAFPGIGIKKLVASIAPIEKV
ncbi:ATP-dependent DNA helicase PcrA [bacterium DOLZORAL124_38_8]|nr:MAG: ATP-dependent DNA helicase PcrA [bacterium DOLZORAL124_38_8]